MDSVSATPISTGEKGWCYPSPFMHVQMPNPTYFHLTCQHMWHISFLQWTKMTTTQQPAVHPPPEYDQTSSCNGNPELPPLPIQPLCPSPHLSSLFLSLNDIRMQHKARHHGLLLTYKHMYIHTALKLHNTLCSSSLGSALLLHPISNGKFSTPMWFPQLFDHTALASDGHFLSFNMKASCLIFSTFVLLLCQRGLQRECAVLHWNEVTQSYKAEKIRTFPMHFKPFIGLLFPPGQKLSVFMAKGHFPAIKALQLTSLLRAGKP